MERFKNDIKKALAVLDKGETILYPTDTIWGLGCDATRADAVDKISELKKRPENKSFIALMADAEMLKKYLAKPIPDLESFIAEQDGPTTIIYNNIIGVAANALAPDGSLGIRIPKDDFCIELIKQLGKPIISTSANLSGKPAPATYTEVCDTVKHGVAYKVHWRQDDNMTQLPSKIIKLNEDGSILKIR